MQVLSEHKKLLFDIFDNHEFFQYMDLFEEFATLAELKQLAKKHDKNQILSLASTFLKRRNWIKWRKYFQAYANAKDKTTLQNMIDSNQIDRAYYYMQHKFANALEALAFYANGAIVAKILLYLPTRDMKQISKVSKQLAVIADKYHLEERRKNMGLLTSFQRKILGEPFITTRIMQSCFGHNFFCCLEEANLLHVAKKDDEIWTFKRSPTEKEQIVGVFCAVTNFVAYTTESNKLHIFDWNFTQRKLKVTFQFPENVKIESVALSAFKQTILNSQKYISYVTTNAGIYELIYNFLDPETMDLVSANTDQNIAVAFVSKATVRMYKASQKIDIDLENGHTHTFVGVGAISKFWSDSTFFYFQTKTSVFFIPTMKKELVRIGDLKMFLPQNFNKFSDIKTARLVPDVTITSFKLTILYKNGIVETFENGVSRVVTTNIIDTAFEGPAIYWVEDDPKWPVIASQCVTCGIEAEDMFGCGNTKTCSAVYCSSECAEKDWHNHKHECKFIS